MVLSLAASASFLPILVSTLGRWSSIRLNHTVYANYQELSHWYTTSDEYVLAVPM